jgi:hypothetical protein
MGSVWRLEERPGRGVCLVAAESLAAGQLVTEDRPLLVVPPEAHATDPAHLDRWLAAAVAELPGEARGAVEALADCRAGPEGGSLRGLYFTNCCMLGQGDACPTGLLPTLARANHSCRPAAEFHWDPERGPPVPALLYLLN